VPACLPACLPAVCRYIPRPNQQSLQRSAVSIAHGIMLTQRRYNTMEKAHNWRPAEGGAYGNTKCVHCIVRQGKHAYSGFQRLDSIRSRISSIRLNNNEMRDAAAIEAPPSEWPANHCFSRWTTRLFLQSAPRMLPFMLRQLIQRIRQAVVNIRIKSIQACNCVQRVIF